MRVQGTVEFGLVPVNPVGGESGIKDLEVEVLNVGTQNLTVNSATCVVGNRTDFTALADSASPLVVSSDSRVSFLIRFNPTAAGARSATSWVPTDDVDQPTIDILANGTGAVPDIKVTGALDFGKLTGNETKDLAVQILNTGPRICPSLTCP